NSHGGELDESKEVGTKFVIARRDAAKLLQSVEEALDAIAFAIKGLGPPVLGFAIGSVRDVGHRTLVTDMRADVVGVIGLVGDDDGTVRPLSRASAQEASCASPGEIRSRPDGLSRRPARGSLW